MKAFLDFITEEITHTIHKLDNGNVVYSHDIGDHQVQTHFYPRVSDDKNKHYDVHFIRKTKGSKANGFSRQGIGSMSIDDRLKSIYAVKKSLKHFIDNESPDSLIASPNTKQKADWSHDMLSKLGKPKNGLVVRKGNEITLTLNNGKK